MPAPPPPPPPRAVGPALAALLLVVAAYAGSLDGGWVWDDHLIIAANPALDSVAQTLQSDVFGPATGEPGDVWRPLAMLSFVPGHHLGWGPAGERVLNLLLHLATAATLAACGRGLGAGPAAAWLGALVYALHPAAAELVAWPSGRQDLLALLLLAGGTAAWLRERPWLAAVALSLAPYAKETLLVAPAVALLWGLRRPHAALVLPVLAAPASLGLRQLLDLPVEPGALDVGLLGPAGGAAARLLHLLAVPTAADALPLYAPRPVLGALALAAGAALLLAARGRPAVAACAGLLLPAAPAALAMAHTGLASDRYLATSIAAVGLALAAALGARPLPRLVLLLPLLLALATGARARDWRSDSALFGHSLARDPANPHAAFHVAHDLHLRQGDCPAAIPLYRQGLAADPRAGTNLLACLVDTGRLDEALAEGPAIAQASAAPKPAANLARAASLAGDLPTALRWAEEAVRRDPDHARNRVLLGQLQAQAGDWDAAERSFRAALAADPTLGEAATLLERVQQARGE